MATKHYIIAGHGRIDLEGELVTDEYNQTYGQLTNGELIELPDNCKVVCYIPPGTVMSAKGGETVYKWLGNNLGSAPSPLTKQFLNPLKEKIEAVEKQYKKYRFYRFFYTTEDVASSFPMIVDNSSNRDIYAYELSGPKEQGEIDKLPDMNWGIAEHKGTGSADWDIIETSSINEKLGTIDQIINTYKPTGSDIHYFHFIFCRVEVLKDSAQEALYDDLQTDMVKFIHYT